MNSRSDTSYPQAVNKVNIYPPSNPHYRTGSTVGEIFTLSAFTAPVCCKPYQWRKRFSSAKILYVNQLSYIAMLAFTIFGSFWLEIALKVRVLKRIRRAMMAIAPVAACFLLWDAYAIANKHWYFDKEQIIGLFGPLNIPLEEYLFFIVIPLAAIMTIEAVRNVKKHWIIGDEK